MYIQLLILRSQFGEYFCYVFENQMLVLVKRKGNEYT